MNDQLGDEPLCTDGGNDENNASDQHSFDDWERPWTSEKVLRRLYVGEDHTVHEIADKLGCSASTISRWNIKHGITSDVHELELPEYSEPPWQDRELMDHLYNEEELSTTEIAVVLDCSTGNVNQWMEKHSLDRRNRSRAAQNRDDRLWTVGFHTSKRGYEYWSPGDHYVFVHRLLAVAEYGVDAVADNDIHHINEIHWDNRPSNIEPLSAEDHQKEHLKIDGLERMEIAEFYENGTISSRDLAEMFDISGGTVLAIHGEFYS